MTFHFYLTLPGYEHERPAKVEWLAGDYETALRIVTEMHPEFIVTPNEALNA